MSEVFRFPVLQRHAHQQTAEQQAQIAYDKGLNAGIEQGTEQGIALGRSQAREQAEVWQKQQLEQEISRLTAEYQQRFNTLEAQLQQHNVQQEQDLRQAVFELLSKLAETVLETELSINPQQLQQAITHTLKALQSTEQIQSIWLAPADIEALQQLGISRIGNTPLLADDSLPTGSAQFTGSSQLHLLDFRQRLSEAMVTVRQQLLEHPGA
ncbi:FliH/SctL family protein [Chromatiaceae bacterium AAb-1]|nr:FliH/SctL family protein [Chromatiaceae bacterium AAb-1]